MSLITSFFIAIDLNVNKQWPCGGNPNQYSKNLEGRHCQWKVLTKVLAVNWVLRIDFEFLYTNLLDSKRYSPFWLCEIKCKAGSGCLLTCYYLCLINVNFLSFSYLTFSSKSVTRSLLVDQDNFCLISLSILISSLLDSVWML